MGKTEARSPALNERDRRPKYSWARDTRHLTTLFLGLAAAAMMTGTKALVGSSSVGWDAPC